MTLGLKYNDDTYSKAIPFLGYTGKAPDFVRIYVEQLAFQTPYQIVEASRELLSSLLVMSVPYRFVMVSSMLLEVYFLKSGCRAQSWARPAFGFGGLCRDPDRDSDERQHLITVGLKPMSLYRDFTEIFFAQEINSSHETFMLQF